MTASAACTSQNGSRQSAIAPVTVYRLPSATRAKTANARWRGKHSKGVMTHDCIAAIPLSLSRQGCETSQCHGSGETVSEARLARIKGPAASVGLVQEHLRLPAATPGASQEETMQSRNRSRTAGMRTSPWKLEGSVKFTASSTCDITSRSWSMVQISNFSQVIATNQA